MGFLSADRTELINGSPVPVRVVINEETGEEYKRYPSKVLSQICYSQPKLLKLKTQWCHKVTYLDGYIRSGVNKTPEKLRPDDVIRLKIKTKDGTGDCDLQLESCEAADIIKVLKTAKKRFREISCASRTLKRRGEHRMPETRGGNGEWVKFEEVKQAMAKLSASASTNSAMDAICDSKPCETVCVQNSGFGQCLGSYPCPDRT